MYAWNSRIWKSKNGCRTIYEKMDCTNNISVIIICCQVGSIHETTETDGFAHLLEHILLTSDTNHISCTQTFQQFDKMGVEFNAHTTKTNTCFMIKCLTPFIKTVIDMLANIMFHSNIETRNAAVEQNVIYHENQTDDNDSINTAELKFKHNVYKDTPYAKPIDKKRANQPPVQSPLLQAFYKNDAFKKDYDELKKDFYDTRAYFDNAHENMTDVWQYERVNGKERFGHATPKPVDMLTRAVKSSSPKEAIVTEPFLGSGSTLIACEKTQRRCYGMELDPQYVDVIVQRYVEYTGNNKIKLNGESIEWELK